MLTLLDLPQEILHSIAANAEVDAVVNLSKTCRTLYSLLQKNHLLFKQLYLRDWDPLARSSSDFEPYFDGLKRTHKLRKLLDSRNLQTKVDHAIFALPVIDNLVIDAQASECPPRNFPKISCLLEDDLNREAYLCQSTLFLRPFRHPGTLEILSQEPLRQSSAKLHCLYGSAVATFPHSHGQRSFTYHNYNLRPRAESLHAPRTGSTPGQNEAIVSISFRGENEDAVTEIVVDQLDVDLPGLPTYPYAASKVYDLRNFTQNTKWGPFKNDGSMEVDWEKLEAIMIVLSHNLNMLSERTEGFFKQIWGKPFDGLHRLDDPVSPVRSAGSIAEAFARHSSSHIDACQSLTNQEKEEERQRKLDAEDPYGVTGTWMRVVCFLDYREFYGYNFTAPMPPKNQPRPPLDTEEATRLIIMRAKVTEISWPDGENSQVESGNAPATEAAASSAVEAEAPAEREVAHPDRAASVTSQRSALGKKMPKVYFRGTSRSMHSPWDENANSKLRGEVQMTPQGEVRWTTWSIYQGEERWRSEGIQIGGIKAPRGVFGNWFDKDYDRYGPAGPTAFWKISEEADSRVELAGIRED